MHLHCRAGKEAAHEPGRWRSPPSRVCPAGWSAEGIIVQRSLGRDGRFKSLMLSDEGALLADAFARPRRGRPAGLQRIMCILGNAGGISGDQAGLANMR